MIEFFNQHSALIAIPAFIVALVAVLPIQSWRKRIVTYSASGGIAFLIVLSLQPGDSTVESSAEAQAVITSGSPVFVEFFSNSCAACLASQPVVKSLEGELNEEIQVLKLNVQDPISLNLVRDYRAFITPTFLVIGRDGEVLWRQSGRLLDKFAALDALKAD